MKILFVAHTAHKYGASRSLLAMMEGLSARGVSCRVVLPKDGPFTEDLQTCGIPYDIVPFKWWATNRKSPIKRWLRMISHHVSALAIARTAAAWGADVIHTNSSVTPVGAFAARRAGIPHVWHVREYGEEDYSLTYDRGFVKSVELMANLSYQLVIISEALAKKYGPYVAPEQRQVVYNPIALHQSNVTSPPTAEGRSVPQLVTIGFMHPGKGIEDAILAIAHLLEQGREVTLNIVGDGDPAYAASLKRLAQQYNAAEHVSFLGYLDDPGAVMQSADAVLVCSRSEAFGRVTIEGMLHEKPIIAARAGASSELVTEKVNGLLYDPGVSDQLAAAIAYLLDHPQEAQEMGRNGYRYASETFTIERHVDAMADLFYAAQNAKSDAN